MAERCKRCININTELCDKCRNQSITAKYTKYSYFSCYKPVCPIGYKLCIHDPAYIQYFYPQRYTKLYGDLSPEEAAKLYCKRRIKDGICRQYEVEDLWIIGNE